LYRIDLAADALERVTVPPDGGPSLGGQGLSAQGHDGASAPSFAADGRTLVFAANAFNLVSGDANGASDVFAVADRSEVTDPGTRGVAPPPPFSEPSPEWRMAVSAVSRADGSVRLNVVVPGAGTLRANAEAVVRIASHARSARHGRRQLARARLAE